MNDKWADRGQISLPLSSKSKIVLYIIPRVFANKKLAHSNMSKRSWSISIPEFVGTNDDNWSRSYKYPHEFSFSFLTETVKTCFKQIKWLQFMWNHKVYSTKPVYIWCSPNGVPIGFFFFFFLSVYDVTQLY